MKCVLKFGKNCKLQLSTYWLFQPCELVSHARAETCTAAGNRKWLPFAKFPEFPVGKLKERVFLFRSSGKFPGETEFLKG